MRGKESGRGNVKVGGDARKKEEEEMGGVKEGWRDQSRWEGRKEENSNCKKAKSQHIYSSNVTLA